MDCPPNIPVAGVRSQEPGAKHGLTSVEILKATGASEDLAVAEKSGIQGCSRSNEYRAFCKAPRSVERELLLNITRAGPGKLGRPAAENSMDCAEARSYLYEKPAINF